jgi:hypothetical protein
MKKSPLFHWVPPFLDSSLPFVYHALANAFTCLSQYEGLLGFCLSIKRKRTGFPGKLEIVHDYWIF